MVIGRRYPVAEYLQGNIVDGRTISNTGSWWTAVLVVQNPENEKRYIALYRWRRAKDGWKKMSSFKINGARPLEEILTAIDELRELLDE